MTLFEDDLEFILDRTASLWPAMAGESLFLTGGTGFFGRWMTESFDWVNRRLALGARRLTLTRRDEFGPEYWRGEVTSFAYPPGRFAFVLHLAFDASDLAATGPAAAHVAGFTRRCGCRRWLLTSSGAAYQPETPLGAAKLAAERAATAAIIARCFSFVGPHQPLDASYAVGNFLAGKIAGRPIQIHGDGKAVRGYLYAAELAVHLWRLLFAGEPGTIHDVGSRQPVTLLELAEMLDHPVEVLNHGPGSTVYLAERGIDPEIPLDVALERTERWYRERLQCDRTNAPMVATT